MYSKMIASFNHTRRHFITQYVFQDPFKRNTQWEGANCIKRIV